MYNQAHGSIFYFKISRLLCSHLPAVPPHSVEQCTVCQVRVSHSAEVFAEISVVALVQHHVGVSVPKHSQPGHCWFPPVHFAALRWECQSITLTSVTPRPEAIFQGNTAIPGRHFTGVEERFIQALPAFICQTVVRPLLFWYESYCPFRSGHIFIFGIYIFLPKLSWMCNEGGSETHLRNICWSSAIWWKLQTKICETNHQIYEHFQVSLMIMTHKV